VTELLHSEIVKVEGLVQAGVALMALIMIVVVWARTKAFVPTIGAVLFGALVIWAVRNVDFLQQKVNDEFHSQGMPALMVKHPEAPGIDA
jgi:hypothetical protein